VDAVSRHSLDRPNTSSDFQKKKKRVKLNKLKILGILYTKSSKIGEEVKSAMGSERIRKGPTKLEAHGRGDIQARTRRRGGTKTDEHRSRKERRREYEHNENLQYSDGSRLMEATAAATAGTSIWLGRYATAMDAEIMCIWLS